MARSERDQKRQAASSAPPPKAEMCEAIGSSGEKKRVGQLRLHQKGPHHITRAEWAETPGLVKWIPSWETKSPAGLETDPCAILG